MMEQTVDKSKILYSIFHNDSHIDFEVTDQVLLIANFLGNHLEILRSVYKSYRILESQMTYKPKIGAEVRVNFDYQAHTVTFYRNDIELTFTESQFLIFLGKIDAIYSEILPIGSIVELDEEMLPPVIKEQLENSGIAELVMISGRRIPLPEPYNEHIIDYYAYIWPIGKLPSISPITVSNMMIKKVVHVGFTNALEETFALDVLRATQLAKEQISSAFMPVAKGLAYLKEHQDWFPGAIATTLEKEDK